jgi:hypothetical protein
MNLAATASRRSSRLFARLSLTATVLLVAACGAKLPPPLSAEQRGAYTVEKVVVTIPETTKVWWGKGDRLVAEAAGVDTSDQGSIGAHMKTDEAQAELRRLAIERLEPIILNQVRGALTGTRPAQLSVVATEIWVSSSAQQVLIGGSHQMWGGIQLYDLKTGEPLTRPQRMWGIGGGGGGILGAVIDAAREDPLARTGSSFGLFSRNWLTSIDEFKAPFTPEQNTVPPPIPGPAIETEQAPADTKPTT